MATLRTEYKNRTKDYSVDFFNGYNPSHLGGIGDITQAAAQTLNSSVSGFDLTTILLQIHPQVTTRKLVLVGHSQGSFYANEMYKYLLAHGEPKAAVGVYHVGTPASSVAGGGKYLTSSNDSIINAARTIALSAKDGLIPLAAQATAPKAKAPLPGNITLSGADYGHGFSSVYLAEAPQRVVGDIQSTIKNLKAEWASDTGECFTAPSAGLSYQAAKAGFAVGDVAAAGIKAGAVAAGQGLAAVAQGAYGVATKIVKGVGIAAGASAGLSKAATPDSGPSDFDLFRKVYGSSVTKEEYQEIVSDLGHAVVTAPLRDAAPVPQPEVVKKIIYLSGKNKRNTEPAPKETATEPAPEAPQEPAAPADTTPPVIEPAPDLSFGLSSETEVIEYDVPAALDETDGAVEVLCTPPPGSVFVAGTTTVACSAHDAAGNIGTTAFAVGVVVAAHVPAPFTIASQEDESTMCEEVYWGGWQDCYVSPDPNTGIGIFSVDLGSGHSGALDSLTIAASGLDTFNPYLITIECFADEYVTPCTGWVAPSTATANRDDAVVLKASDTSDGKYWTAYFAYKEGRSQAILYPKNADGSAPVMLNPEHYYRLSISDLGWSFSIYGSATEPYWVLTGIK